MRARAQGKDSCSGLACPPAGPQPSCSSLLSLGDPPPRQARQCCHGSQRAVPQDPFKPVRPSLCSPPPGLCSPSLPRTPPGSPAHFPRDPSPLGSHPQQLLPEGRQDPPSVDSGRSAQPGSPLGSGHRVWGGSPKVKTHSPRAGSVTTEGPARPRQPSGGGRKNARPRCPLHFLSTQRQGCRALHPTPHQSSPRRRRLRAAIRPAVHTSSQHGAGAQLCANTDCPWPGCLGKPPSGGPCSAPERRVQTGRRGSASSAGPQQRTTHGAGQPGFLPLPCVPCTSHIFSSMRLHHFHARKRTQVKA